MNVLSLFDGMSCGQIALAKIIMVFITKSYQDLFGVRSYINAKYKS